MGVLVVPASATFRSRYLHLINRSRVRRDLRPLKLHLKLSGDALAHTHNMIRKNRLFDIGDLVLLLYPYAGSKTIGADVVGCGSTLAHLHKRMLHEAHHRRILLSPKTRYAGIGVIKDTGRSPCGKDDLWATTIVYG